MGLAQDLQLPQAATLHAKCCPLYLVVCQPLLLLGHSNSLLSLIQPRSESVEVSRWVEGGTCASLWLWVLLAMWLDWPWPLRNISGRITFEKVSGISS